MFMSFLLMGVGILTLLVKLVGCVVIGKSFSGARLQRSSLAFLNALVFVIFFEWPFLFLALTFPYLISINCVF